MALTESDKKTLISNLKKDWQKILIDKEMSERELFRDLGLTQQIWNKKIKTGTIKYYELVYLLEVLGYKIKIIENNKNVVDN